MILLNLAFAVQPKIIFISIVYILLITILMVKPTFQYYTLITNHLIKICLFLRGEYKYLQKRKLRLLILYTYIYICILLIVCILRVIIGTDQYLQLILLFIVYIVEPETLH